MRHNNDETKAIVEAAFGYRKGSLANVTVLEENIKGFRVDLDDFYFAPRRVQEFLIQKQK